MTRRGLIGAVAACFWGSPFGRMVYRMQVADASHRMRRALRAATSAMAKTGTSFRDAARSVARLARAI